MKIYIHGFWNGFITKTDPIHVDFFIDLLKSVFSETIHVSTDKEKCDILLESVFTDKTCLFDKKWKATFLFSGESYLNKWANLYDCVLSGFKTFKKNVQLPFYYVYYKHINSNFHKLNTVPPKGICAIISNGNAKERNNLIEKINEKFPIDFSGKYKNNVDIISGNYNSEELQNFIRQYKFVITMENTYQEGYITEKIFHGLRNGTIPIYWGTSDVNVFFNSERIVNASDPDFLDKIEKLSIDKDLYMKTVSNPVFNKEFNYYNMIREMEKLLQVSPQEMAKPVKNFTDATVLLNMIVKNEAHVIEKTLANLCDKINFKTYVISDTGSTDNTKALIKAFFDKKGIEGEIYDDEWKDFGYNRTRALEYAYDKSDFLFVFDADDELHGDFAIPKTVDYDSYHLKFGSGNDLSYYRTCLVNNRKRWEYVGVLHEYIHLVDGQGDIKNVHVNGNYYVKHGITGGRSQDPDKYKKDAAILDKAFHELPESNTLRNRYAFYCANSYKDSKNFDKAIEWYVKTTQLSGWSQEKYRSCIMLCDIYRVTNQVEKSMYWAVKSFQFDDTRAEGILKLVQHYCIDNMNALAYNYYTLIQTWYETIYLKNSLLPDKLFVDILDYDFFLPYYMIIVSDKVGKKEIGVKMYDMIFSRRKVAGQWWIDNLTFNFQFFYKLIGKDKIFADKALGYLKLLESANLTVRENFYHNIYEMM